MKPTRKLNIGQSAIEFGNQIRRGTQTTEKTAKSERLEQIRTTRRLNKDSVLQSIREPQMTKSTMRKASGLRSVQSVSGLTDRLTSVTKGRVVQKLFFSVPP